MLRYTSLNVFVEVRDVCECQKTDSFRVPYSFVCQTFGCKSCTFGHPPIQTRVFLVLHYFRKKFWVCSQVSNTGTDLADLKSSKVNLLMKTTHFVLPPAIILCCAIPPNTVFYSYPLRKKTHAYTHTHTHRVLSV